MLAGLAGILRLPTSLIPSTDLERVNQMTIKAYTVAALPVSPYAMPRPVLSDYAKRLMTISQAEGLARDMSKATGRDYVAFNVGAV
jgi:hypothetical protein